MKILSILSLLLTPTAMADTFYYGEHYQTVELRSDQPSLLRFDQSPLSSACQPGILTFEPLDLGTMSMGEKQHVQDAGDGQKDQTINRMVRVIPEEKTGTATCSFTLAGGREVPVKFVLSDKIARPFLDFRPITGKFKTPANSDLGILRSLVNGESIYLHETTKDHEQCQKTSDSMFPCSPLRRSTAIADYELTYSGTDTNRAGWVLKATLKSDQPFASVADLKPSPSQAVYYSAVTPQEVRYQKGAVIKHHILTSSQISATELLEVLP